MAGYARFRRSRSNFRSSGRKRSGGRRSSRAGYRKSYSRKSLPKFATVGYTRNVEKKYFDMSWQGDVFEKDVGNTGNVANNGWMFNSTTWKNYPFLSSTAGAANYSNDLNKGVPSGATAQTRIGNVVKPIYYKGAMTFSAAEVIADTTKSQNGESYVDLATTPTRSYLRTTFRMVIVKDTQVNSIDNHLPWDTVFGPVSRGLGSVGVNGLHSELSIANMGRFFILEDRYFTLDADTPQKTIPWMVSGSKVGNVRYNGDAATALTDKGLYIIFSAFVMGAGGAITAANINLPSPVGHSRFCFTDA
jgi:hypothetical protein